MINYKIVVNMGYMNKKNDDRREDFFEIYPYGSTGIYLLLFYYA